MRTLPAALLLLCLLLLSGCASPPTVVQSGCQVDRSLVVTLSDRKPKQGDTVMVEDILQTILPALVDDIAIDNARKEQLHQQLDKCGV